MNISNSAGFIYSSQENRSSGNYGASFYASIREISVKDKDSEASALRMAEAFEKETGEEWVLTTDYS